MAGETIRDVIIRIRLQQEKASLQAPDLSEYVRASREAKAAIERDAAARPSPVSNLREIKGDLANDITQDSSVKQRLEAYSQIGEGALRAARGVAFMTAATEEDMKVALQYVAAAQGVFDVFAGLASVTKGMVSIRQAAIIARKAEITAEAAGIPVTVAATAVDGNASLIMMTRVGATRAQTAALGQLRAAQMAAAAAQTNLNATMLLNPLTAAIVGVVAAGAVAWHSYSESQKEAAATEKRYADMLANRIQREREAAEVETTVAANRISAIMGIAGTFDDPAERLRALNDAQAQVDAIRRQAPGGVAVTNDVRQQQLQTNIKADEELLRITEARGNAQLDIISGLERQRDVAGQILDTAKRTVEAEKERYRSAEERFGRLSQSEQQRALEIAKRRQSGEQLNENDARFLDRLGIAGNATSQFFQQRGAAAGFGQFAEGFGLGDALKQAQENLKSTMATAGEAYNTAIDELTDEMAKFKKAVEKNLALRGVIKESAAEMERLNADMERQKQQQLSSKVANAKL